MTVYLDIVFLENICMNYIILYATALIMKIKIKHIRIIISSIIGGLYAIISVLPVFQEFANIVFKILISILMVYIAYKTSNTKELFKKLVLFYLTSFVFGGCAFALLYFIKPQDIFMRNGVYIGKYPIKIVLLGGIVGFCLLINAFKLIKERINKKDIYCVIEIEFNRKKVKVKSLIDTGNMLKEPISNMPVIIVQKDMLRNILPKEILQNTNNIINGKSSSVIKYLENEECNNRFRLIPFSSLGEQHGLLLGFKADNVRIKYNEEIKEIKNVIIGIYEKELSKNNTYTALVGLDTVYGEGLENEYIKYAES